MAYIHTCPYCGTTLSVERLTNEKVASKCPHCNRVLLLFDYGAQVKKPYVYKCYKCGEEHVFDRPVPFVQCDKCGSTYVTAGQDSAMIESDLLSRGDNGELPYTKKKDHYSAAMNMWRKSSIITKTIVAILLLVFMCVGGVVYYLSRPIDIEKSQAYEMAESVWNEFREKNPYNFQAVGLRRYDDDSYIAIISEPTEGVLEEQLQEVFKKYNCNLRTFKKQIGYDGWLRDAVVCFNDASEKDIPKIAKKLFSLLYGTDYKAEFMDYSTLPTHTSFSEQNLNYQVTEEELRQWFLTDKEMLVNVEDSTQEFTLAECLENSNEGMQVLMSKTPGFIIWVMNTGYCDYEAFRIYARKFAIDSDLIFGAISAENRVAIIARERILPLYELPPMRQEILHLLASTDEDELAQSYERTSLFAGKQQGGKDYAPIYLSDELWHTEYGNMLNITDQMLKSWSENGLIEYAKFDYTKPVNWTFHKGVSKDLGVSELTYNWNTSGVGYEVCDDDYTIYALNRTGSLPVSYIPGETEGISDNDPVYRAEEQAYDFFSDLSSPELVKVVQYVSMYQIFRNLNIKCPYYYYDEDQVMKVPEALVKLAGKTVAAVSNFGEQQKREIAKYYNLEVVSEKTYLSQAKYTHGYCIGNDSYIVIRGKAHLPEMLQAISLIQDLQDVHDSLAFVAYDKTFMSCLPSYLLDRNGTELEYDGDGESFSSLKRHFEKYEDRIYAALNAIGKHGFELQKFNFIIGDASVEECKNYYLEENKDKSKLWMKCPTIVESWSVNDSATMVGGHNLDSKVTRFRIAKDLKPGQTRETFVNGRKVIEISRADMRTHGTDPSYLRRVGRLDNAKLLGREVPVRAKFEVISNASKRTSRGFNATDHLTIQAKGSSFEINGRKVTLTELFDHIAESMTKGSAPVKEIEIVGIDRAGTEVSAIVDGISYHMPKGQRANLAMAKYDFASHTVTYSGDKAVIKIPIKAGSIEYGSTSQVIEAGIGGTTQKTNKFNIESGDVTFEIHKSKTQKFIEILKEFFEKRGDYFNELIFRQKLKKYNISPSEYQEKHHLRVAKIYYKYYNNKHKSYHVNTVQEKNIA